jgi:thiaminase
MCVDVPIAMKELFQWAAVINHYVAYMLKYLTSKFRFYLTGQNNFITIFAKMICEFVAKVPSWRIFISLLNTIQFQIFFRINASKYKN